jgi:lycopene beta-cyclase
MQQQYDYIIAGAGCAGLSLLYRMLQQPFFSTKKILLIDKQQKIYNDRTWCFWEKQPGIFEEIVYRRWKQIDFYSNEFSARFDLAPYEYKMIRGIDLYEMVLNEATKNPNVSFLYDEVRSVLNEQDQAVVTTCNNEFSSSYVFNSIFFNDLKQQATQQKNTQLLLQHFKGWLIETDKDHFDERIADFMDFRTTQNNGTAFMYVLPVATNKALIEYTLFTENVSEPDEYDAALNRYIHEVLNIGTFSVQHEEYGVIPMTDYRFSKGEGRLVNIGVSGGQVKGSSGYTFQFIQKHSAKIIDALTQEKSPLIKQGFGSKRYRLYDSILLKVLSDKKMKADKLFSLLFKKNPIEAILKFLDNESNFKEELKIMNSMPANIFVPIAIQKIARNTFSALYLRCNIGL